MFESCADERPRAHGGFQERFMMKMSRMRSSRGPERDGGGRAGAFATDHPGSLRYRLFSEDEMVFDSGIVGGAIGWFSGLICETPFDQVRISDTDEFGVDDIRFGRVVPAPAASLLLLPGLAMTRRRRRAG